MRYNHCLPWFPTVPWLSPFRGLSWFLMDSPLFTKPRERADHGTQACAPTLLLRIKGCFVERRRTGVFPVSDAEIALSLVAWAGVVVIPALRAPSPSCCFWFPKIKEKSVSHALFWILAVLRTRGLVASVCMGRYWRRARGGWNGCEHKTVGTYVGVFCEWCEERLTAVPLFLVVIL